MEGLLLCILLSQCSSQGSYCANIIQNYVGVAWGCNLH